MHEEGGSRIRALHLRDELQERRGRRFRRESRWKRRGTRISPCGGWRARTALRELVSQYAVRSMASEFIKRTRRMYEEEKQPQVLRLASRYFSMLTGGMYSRIVMRMGDQSLLAERPSGEWWKRPVKPRYGGAVISGDAARFDPIDAACIGGAVIA